MGFIWEGVGRNFPIRLWKDSDGDGMVMCSPNTMMKDIYFYFVGLCFEPTTLSSF
jgi:hypothetical protein